MKIKGKLGISNPSGPDSDREISIEVTCAQSRVRFAKVSISYEDFSRALMSQWDRPCEIEVLGLDCVGKRYESKELVFELDCSGYRPKEKAAELAQSFADEGWTASKYFGSQDSFFTTDGKRFARTTQHRYVAVESKE